MGSLSNRLVDVTTRNMMRVFSVSIGPVMHMAYRDARTYTYVTVQTPAGANDYFFYIRNTSSARDLFITRVAVDGATAETIQLEHVSGTPVGGTAITPGNRNFTQSVTPQVSAEVAADITGLTSVQVYERLLMPAGGQASIELIDRPIILPRNTGITAGFALLAVTGGIALNVLVDIAARSFDQPATE